MGSPGVSLGKAADHVNVLVVGFSGARRAAIIGGEARFVRVRR